MTNDGRDKTKLHAGRHAQSLMSQVKLFGHTYSLPAVMNERFCRLQQQVNTQSRMIQEGIRRRPRWLKIVQFSSVPLSPRERFQELSLLVRQYDAIIEELCQSKDKYQLFFAELAAGVRQALDDKRKEMRSIEHERRSSYQEAVVQQDEVLQHLAREDEERLLQGVRLLGQVALLLLKKIAVCQEGITRLAEDQELQRKVLSQLIGRLDSHRRAYERRQRIDTVVREVAEMAQVALDFEGYMREHLGPLQDLIDKVAQVDEALHRAVTEIKEITQRMLQHNMIRLPDEVASQLTPLDTCILDFLTSVQLQKERLSEVWEHLERQDGSAEAIDVDIVLAAEKPTMNPVLDALDNIQTLVDIRLAPLISGQETVLSTQLPPLEHQLATTPRQERTRRKSLWREMATTAHQLSGKLFSSSNRLALEFVLIPAGAFAMGSAVFADEQPVHEVQIGRPFYLGKYPVTQSQWETVMGRNTSYFRGNPNRPMENVSWEEVQEFITKLNESEGALLYRLPTEAEWEFAARAGSTTDYCFGNDARRLSRYAWYGLNAGGTTQTVRQLRPNAWELYDMHGNVWEWVQDWYDEDYYAQSAHHNPSGPSAGAYRVVRGGSWDCKAGDCRSASRNVEHPGGHSRFVGFRLAKMIL